MSILNDLPRIARHRIILQDGDNLFTFAQVSQGQHLGGAGFLAQATHILLPCDTLYI